MRLITQFEAEAAKGRKRKEETGRGCYARGPPSSSVHVRCLRVSGQVRSAQREKRRERRRRYCRRAANVLECVNGTAKRQQEKAAEWGRKELSKAIALARQTEREREREGGREKGRERDSDSGRLPVALLCSIIAW